MRLRKPVLALLAVALVAVPTPVAAEDADVRSRVVAAAVRHEHIRVRASIGVWDVKTGERLYAKAPDTLRRTASVMKLATTAAALLALGPDHELATDVLVTALPEDGVVDGDLVVRGGGDPGFSEHLHEAGAESAVRALARRVREFGIRRVTGDLILDTSAYPGPARHPGWGWKKGDWAHWSAPVSALTINDGCLDVTARPGPAPGAPAMLETAPRTTLPRVRNTLRTVSSKSDHEVRFGMGEYAGVWPVEIVAEGKVWERSTGYTASLACVDPPALFGDVLRAALTDEGVEIAGASTVVREPSAAPVGPMTRVARNATPLGRTVQVTNTRSQNLFAELLLRELGRRLVYDGSFEGGCGAVRTVLGLGPAEGLEQEDGSGLSRGNRATVATVGRLLLRMYASHRRVAFMSSLARAGEAEGTLRKRLRAERFRGRVLAKTGTLSGTSALAGYVHTTDGRVLAFAILCEGDKWRARQMQDAVVAALVGP